MMRLRLPSKSTSEGAGEADKIRFPQISSDGPTTVVLIQLILTDFLHEPGRRDVTLHDPDDKMLLIRDIQCPTRVSVRLMKLR